MTDKPPVIGDEEIIKGIGKLTEDSFRIPHEHAGLTWGGNFNHMLAGSILEYLKSQGYMSPPEINRWLEEKDAYTAEHDEGGFKEVDLRMEK